MGAPVGRPVPRAFESWADHLAEVGRQLAIHARSDVLSRMSGTVLVMEWKPWLARWSEEWIRSADPAELDPEVLRDRWLGFAPATPDRLEIQLLIAEYQARLRRSGQRLNFGNPEFDVLIKKALDEHATDPDALWQAVRAALVHWRPRTTEHLAPVVLLADPVLAATLTPERGRELLSQPNTPSLPT